MYENDIFQIEDLGSSNGTWLNDQRVDKNIKTPYKINESVFLGGKLGVEVKIEFVDFKGNEINIVLANELSQYKNQVLDDELIKKIARNSNVKIQTPDQPPVVINSKIKEDLIDSNPEQSRSIIPYVFSAIVTFVLLYIFFKI